MTLEKDNDIAYVKMLMKHGRNGLKVIELLALPWRENTYVKADAFVRCFSIEDFVVSKKLLYLWKKI